MPMTTERFFDGQNVSMAKLLTELKMNPNETEEILKYVMDKVKHYAEFEAKKECLKHRYEHKLQKLYAEYMQEE
jgi:chromosome segregation and condensation protein ScpB